MTPIGANTCTGGSKERGSSPWRVGDPILDKENSLVTSPTSTPLGAGIFIACACIGGGEKWDKKAEAGDIGSSVTSGGGTDGGA